MRERERERTKYLCGLDFDKHHVYKYFSIRIFPSRDKFLRVTRYLFKKKKKKKVQILFFLIFERNFLYLCTKIDFN